VLIDSQRPVEKSVRLFEKRGKTSLFFNTEVSEHGDLISSRQDVGKGLLEWWGDFNYEFWVIVASQNKDKVLKALVRCFGQAQLQQPTNIPFDEDLVLLAQPGPIYHDIFTLLTSSWTFYNCRISHSSQGSILDKG
jgi:hypothetical protein